MKISKFHITACSKLILWINLLFACGIVVTPLFVMWHLHFDTYRQNAIPTDSHEIITLTYTTHQFSQLSFVDGHELVLNDCMYDIIEIKVVGEIVKIKVYNDVNEHRWLSLNNQSTNSNNPKGNFIMLLPFTYYDSYIHTLFEIFDGNKVENIFTYLADKGINLIGKNLRPPQNA